MKIFQTQGTFPHSRKFPTFNEFFHIQGIFHVQWTFTQSRNFSTFKELFHSQATFPHRKKIAANKDQKGSPKAKVLDPLNAKSDAKIFLAL